LENEIKGLKGFDENWGLVKNWSERTRYERRRRQEAMQLYQAVSDLDNGVLQWLRRHW
jgi:hypothetical protein